MRFAWVFPLFVLIGTGIARAEEGLGAALQLYRSGDCKEAIARLEKMRPSSEAEYLKGMCWVSLRQNAKARQAFEAVLRLSPQNALRSRSQTYLEVLTEEPARMEADLDEADPDWSALLDFRAGYNSNVFAYGEDQSRVAGAFVSMTPQLGIHRTLGPALSFDLSFKALRIEYSSHSAASYLSGQLRTALLWHSDEWEVQLTPELNQDGIGNESFTRNFGTGLKAQTRFGDRWSAGARSAWMKAQGLSPGSGFMSGSIAHAQPWLEYAPGPFRIELNCDFGRENRGILSVGSAAVPMSQTYVSCGGEAGLWWRERLGLGIGYVNSRRGYNGLFSNFTNTNERSDRTSTGYLSILYWSSERIGLLGELRIMSNQSTITATDGVDLSYRQSLFAAGVRVKL